MNRDRLIDEMLRQLSLPKKEVERIFDVFEETILAALKRGDKVNISGFGQFYVSTRSARRGVNPRNPKEEIQVPAIRVAKFRPGKRLKDDIR